MALPSKKMAASKQFVMLVNWLAKLIPIILAGYAVYAGYYYLNWLTNPYPNEYREAANLHLASLFTRGVNPFGADAPNTFFYMYGFFAGLLNVPFLCLPGCDGLVALRLASLTCLLATAGIVEWYVRRWAPPAWPKWLGFLLVLQTGWITHELIARPDQLGMLLYVCSALVLVCGRGKSTALLAAFLLVLSFYTKQYFILLGAPLFVGAIFTGWQRALAFGLGAGAILLVSFPVVDRVFPYYFSMAVLTYGPTGSEAHSNFWHLRQQIRFWGLTYWPLVLTLLLGCLQLLRKSSSPEHAEVLAPEKSDHDGQRHFWFWLLQFVGGGVFLLYLGKNVGAFLTYFNQFLLVAAVILAALSFRYLLSDVVRFFLVLCIIAVSLFHVGRSFQFTMPLTAEEQENWRRAGSLVLQAGENIDLRTPLLAAQAIELDLPFFDNGLHAYEWLRKTHDSLAQSKSPLLTYFSSEELLAKLGEYQTARAKRLASSRELLIVTDNFGPDKTEEIKGLGYEAFLELPLRSGGQYWQVRFWRKAE